MPRKNGSPSIAGYPIRCQGWCGPCCPELWNQSRHSQLTNRPAASPLHHPSRRLHLRSFFNSLTTLKTTACPASLPPHLSNDIANLHTCPQSIEIETNCRNTLHT